MMQPPTFGPPNPHAFDSVHTPSCFTLFFYNTWRHHQHHQQQQQQNPSTKPPYALLPGRFFFTFVSGSRPRKAARGAGGGCGAAEILRACVFQTAARESRRKGWWCVKRVTAISFSHAVPFHHHSRGSLFVILVIWRRCSAFAAASLASSSPQDADAFAAAVAALPMCLTPCSCRLAASALCIDFLRRLQLQHPCTALSPLLSLPHCLASPRESLCVC